MAKSNINLQYGNRVCETSDKNKHFMTCRLFSILVAAITVFLIINNSAERNRRINGYAADLSMRNKASSNGRFVRNDSDMHDSETRGSVNLKGIDQAIAFTSEQDIRNNYSFHYNLQAQESTSIYNTKGEVRILNKDITHKSGFEKLAAQFQKESGIRIIIETPPERSYSNSLKEKLTKSPQDPTLFMLGGVDDFDKYKYECLDLSDCPVTSQLTDCCYSLRDETKNTYGLACYIEAFGLAINTQLLAEAGYEVSEINSFSDLKRIAENITERKTQLGFSAFTSSAIGGNIRGSYHFSQHAPAVPLYYEVKDNGFNMTEKLNGKYMEQYRDYVDLYLENSTVTGENEISRSIEDAQREFRNDKAVFHQDGSWDADVLPDDGVAVIPIYIGISGEKKQGLCWACEYYWCVNRFASSDDIEATLQFLNWAATSESGLGIMSEKMKLLLPYKKAVPPENVFLQEFRNQEDEGKYMIDQFYKYGDYVKWESLIDQALERYSTDKNSWNQVTEAFKSLW